MSKKIAALVLLCALLVGAVFGCKKNAADGPNPTPTPISAITPQPRMQKAHQAPPPNEGPASTPTTAPTQDAEGTVVIGATPAPIGASVQVVQAAAHALAVDNGVLLYGAVEYQNTGEASLIISQADLNFTWEGGSASTQFAPALAQYDVVPPGGTGYLVYYEPRTDLTAGAAVTLSAALTAQGSAKPRLDMEATNLYLAQNYPGYATLTGTLASRFAPGESCSLNMVYVAFYDAGDKLLGVWNFTRNALFEGAESKNFAEQLKSLPIPGLEENTASMRAVGFGF